MNAQKAFKIWWGIHLHFASLKYSVLTYGTNTKSAQSKYDAMSVSQRYRFDWLSNKFHDHQDLVYACIGCELDGVNIQFGTKEDILDAYHKMKGRRESMTYTIRGDVSKHELLEFVPVNKLIFKYLVGEISPEYVILLCNGTDELANMYNSPNMTWAKDKILKLIKYVPFFNVPKYIKLIENNEHHVNS